MKGLGASVLALPRLVCGLVVAVRGLVQALPKVCLPRVRCCVVGPQTAPFLVHFWSVSARCAGVFPGSDATVRVWWGPMRLCDGL